MVSSISRNWVGGLASGMDTQALIDKIMTAERVPLDRLEQKRNTISYQKSMLQDINLKLFELQNKTTDLIFSRTFNSKSVSASDDKLLSAVASTSAKVGTYTLKVKQLATPTTISSLARLGSSIELGENLKSSKSLGGANTKLSNIGITTGSLNLTIGGATTSVTVGVDATAQDLITGINNAIAGNADMRGKGIASFDQKTNKVKISLLDSTKTLTLGDSAGDTVTKLFSATGSFTLTRDQPVRDSNLTSIRSGLQATLQDLGVNPLSTMTLQRQGYALESLDLGAAGLTAGSTVSDLISSLNHQIDKSPSLIKGGAVTGNPADRLVEFRYDQGSGKLLLANTNSNDTTKFTLDTASGDMPTVLFGNATATSATDAGGKLVNETFSSVISSGSFTLDGVSITIDNQSDTLTSVLTRITSMTGVNASYDSEKDVIRLARKDGSSLPIGLGAASDTSNILSVTGLISGSQQSAALLKSGSALGFSATDALTKDLQTLGLTAPASSGQMKISVNGKESTINWNSTDTLSKVMERIGATSGVEDVWYDESSRTFQIKSQMKGSSASLKLEDLSGGLAGALGIPSGTTAMGLDTGNSLESSRPLSSIQPTATLDKAGLSTAVSGGSFSINGVTFTIGNPGSMTLDSLMTTINNNVKAGVKAEFDAGSGKFILSSKQTGNTAIALGSPTDTSNFLSAMGLSTAPQDVGQNAIFSVSGMYGGADIVRQSNDVSDVITGLTLSLKGTTTGSGETITVASNTESARKAIDAFIESYNTVADLVYTKLTEKHDSSLEALTDTEKKALSAEDLAIYEENYKLGLLSGDSTLSTVRSRMRVAMAGVVSGVDKVFDSLTDIGISTGQVGSGYTATQVGKLSVVDADKLTAALTENPDKVAELFAKDSTSESGMGIARRFKNILNEFTKSDGILTKRAGRSGLSTSNSSMDTQITQLNTQISSQEERLKNREEALMKQFSALESAMSKYQTQSQAFSSQLAQLTGSSS
ncbi:MAG TPA: flagellar filament capping protein FliD [Candidatus Ozemobacteraceae bacterium]|nr:flagellar filament capping protein FliD [Candidatus Ozemobacteraceae bacterium]